MIQMFGHFAGLTFQILSNHVNFAICQVDGCVRLDSSLHCIVKSHKKPCVVAMLHAALAKLRQVEAQF